MSRILAFAAAFLIGAVLCTVLDHQHVVWGVLYYPHPDFWQQAWWVPLLFFTGTLGALTATGAVRRLLRAPEGPRPMAALVAVDVASFAAAYYLTAVGHRAPNMLTAILVGTWLVRAASSLSGWAVAFCIGMALVGPAVESAVSALGGFYYYHPDFIGVARWLPALYLHAGVAGVSVSTLLRAPIEIDVVV
jgi:hypothetical protein